MVDPKEDERIARLNYFIERTMRGGKLSCPGCGLDEWIFGGIYGVPRIDPETRRVFTATTAPLAMLACTTCASVHFVSWNMVMERTSDWTAP